MPRGVWGLATRNLNRPIGGPLGSKRRGGQWPPVGLNKIIKYSPDCVPRRRGQRPTVLTRVKTPTVILWTVGSILRPAGRPQEFDYRSSTSLHSGAVISGSSTRFPFGRRRRLPAAQQLATAAGGEPSGCRPSFSEPRWVAETLHNVAVAARNVAGSVGRQRAIRPEK